MIGHDPGVDAATASRLGIRPVALPELFASSEILSLHCEMNSHTAGLSWPYSSPVTMDPAIVAAARSSGDRKRPICLYETRALGTDIPSPATSRPFSARMGTAHPTTPTATSSLLVAQPDARTVAISERMAEGLTTVFGVTAASWACDSQETSSSSVISARYSLPIDVQ